MICPKGKISRSRRDKRRAQNWKIGLPAVALCPKCGEYMMPFHVCESCGYYNKRMIFNKKAE
jgi:large subunit ribosomal protein L32